MSAMLRTAGERSIGSVFRVPERTWKAHAADHMTNADILELFTESAASREYDGGTSREHAENRALMDVRKITGELPAWLVEHVERLQRERKENG